MLHHPSSVPNSSSRDRGAIAVIAVLCFVPLLLGLAVVADGSRTWIERERLQNGVEAGAVAVAKKWISSGTSCQNAELAYITADGATPSSQKCLTTGTHLNGTVRIEAAGTVDLLFSGLLGRSRSNISASTGVKIGTPQSMAGVWPFALCVNVPEVSAWLASQLTQSAPVTITFSSQKPACGGNIPGNWGTLDFNGGSNSTAETNVWIVDGYSQEVNVGDTIFGNPGAPSTSLDIAAAIGTTFLFALYDSANGTGNGAAYHVVGFATAKLISARLTGGTNQRSFTIQFTRGSGQGTPGTGNVNYGLTAWAVCSHDAQGVCE